MKEEEYLRLVRDLWKKSWPDNLPEEPVYPFGQRPITEYLREWARRAPERPALVFYGEEVTFQELDDLSDRFAGLLASLGLGKGDRVAVFLPNCPQFLVAFYGILKLGCVHVPVNPLFKERELLYELKDSGARVIVAADALYPLVEAVKEEAGLREVIATSPSEYVPEEPTIPVPESLLAPVRECPGAVNMLSALREAPVRPPEVEVGLDDLAALNYTGGTTGMPKGCEHTQGDMLYTAATAATYNFESLGPDDVALAYLPVFWIAGEDTGVLLPVFSGATHVLLARWDAGAALEAIARYGVTCAGGVVDNLVELMEHPEAGRYDLGSVRTVLAISFVKKVNPEYRRRWAELSGGRATMREAAYGMTETHTFDTFTTGLQGDEMDLESKPPLFCGLPQPGTEFKILDFDTDELLPLGEEGEIAVRTPSLLKTYWNNPEETQAALKDGWLRTGDIGMLDEGGYLHYLGRRKEMLKVKGMSVFPSEIETLLGQHPSVVGSGVVGRPDPEKGEVPVAFVKVIPGGQLDEEELSVWCRENMAAYKVPVVRIVDELPMTATGKVRKEDLKALESSSRP